MAKEKASKRWQILLILYGGIMLWLLFGRSTGWVDGIPYREQLRRNANLEPLRTIKNYLWVLRHSHDRHLLKESIINLGGNVLLFIPVGLLFPRVWPFLRKFFLYLAFCAGIILLVEITQLFTLLGSFDVDDVILNLAGMSLGFLLFKAAKTTS